MHYNVRLNQEIGSLVSGCLDKGSPLFDSVGWMGC